MSQSLLLSSRMKRAPWRAMQPHGFSERKPDLERCSLLRYLTQTRENLPEMSENRSSVFSELCKKIPASMCPCKLLFLVIMHYIQEITLYSLVWMILNQKCKQDLYSFQAANHTENRALQVSAINTITCSLLFKNNNTRGSVFTTTNKTALFSSDAALLPLILADTLLMQPNHLGKKYNLFMILQHFFLCITIRIESQKPQNWKGLQRSSNPTFLQ